MNPLRKLLPAFVTALAVVLLLTSTARAQAAPVVWKESETGTQTVQGTWTWDKDNKRFAGRWSNGAVGYLRLKKFDKEQVILNRYDHEGVTAGLQANYVGKRNGNSIQGTVEWKWNGRVTRGTWTSKSTAPSTSHATVRLNTAGFPNEREKLASPAERRSFPRLGTNYEVLAPSTPYQGKLNVIRRSAAITVLAPEKTAPRKVYNCIAHSLGIHYGWVNPETGPAANPLTKMDQMYRVRGYTRLSTLDYRLVPGKQKVVVYATVNANRQIKAVTHAAIQSPDGTWTSKLGALALIRHVNPQALNGPTYGQPVAVYIRNHS
jgi:hypothetical protein